MPRKSSRQFSLRRREGFELVVDSGGELPDGVPVGSRAAPAVFNAADLPDAVAEIAGHLANAEGVGMGLVSAEIPPATKRHKNRHKREALKGAQKG